jgi:RimJ/RimL family protein N-acetyltransferase
MPAALRRPVRCLPREFSCKRGEPVRLALLDEATRPRLVAMYLAYQPRNSFQGLPPIKDVICRKWVEDMIRTGINVVARGAGGDVVGHIALFPIDDRKCEMLVVVSPEFQNAGIGTELTRSIIAVAAEQGFQQIWLPVAANNLRARHVYRKCGFEYVPGQQGRELDMLLDLVVRDRVLPPVPVLTRQTDFPPCRAAPENAMLQGTMERVPCPLAAGTCREPTPVETA